MAFENIGPRILYIVTIKSMRKYLSRMIAICIGVTYSAISDIFAKVITNDQTQCENSLSSIF